jgi:hypothetical protein
MGINFRMAHSNRQLQVFYRRRRSMSSLGAELWGMVLRHEFTDTVLILGTREYACHRAVLAATPGYFADLFRHKFCEQSCSYISIRINDPCDAFIHVLHFIYTGNTSQITRINAIAIHTLASYFRLPALAQAAELEFASITDPTDALRMVTQAEPCLLPPKLVDFFAQSFHTLLGNGELQKLSPHLIVQIVTNPNLRIRSDFELAGFLGTFPFDDATFKILSEVIEWSFLSGDDWDFVNGELFGISESQKREFQAFHRIFEQEKGAVIVNIAIDSQNTGTIARLERYVPPPVEFFGLDNGLFTGPKEQYGLIHRQFDESGQVIVLAMGPGHLLYITYLEMVFVSFRGVLAMSVQVANGGQSEIKDYGIANVDGKGVFRAEIRAKFAYRSAEIRFIPDDVRRFKLESSKAKGFVVKT